MIRKVLVAGLLVNAGTSLSFAGQEEQGPTNRVRDLLDAHDKIELEVCEAILNISEAAEPSAQDLADLLILKRLIQKISDEPLQYCQEKFLMSNHSITEPVRKK